MKLFFACQTCVYFVKGRKNICVRSRCSEADDDINQKRQNKGRQQLINAKDAANRCNQELPDKYHDASDNHTGQRTLQGGTLPEQCQQNNRAEGCAEACPSKRYNLKYRAVRIACQEYRDNRDDNNSQTSCQNALLLGQFDAEQILQQILREAGGGGEPAESPLWTW